MVSGLSRSIWLESSPSWLWGSISSNVCMCSVLDRILFCSEVRLDPMAVAAAIAAAVPSWFPWLEVDWRTLLLAVEQPERLTLAPSPVMVSVVGGGGGGEDQPLGEAHLAS